MQQMPLIHSGGSANELSWFETGVNDWVNTLNEIGISVSFSTSSPDEGLLAQLLTDAGKSW